MTMVLEIALPQYVLGPELDADASGSLLDDFIVSHIECQRIAIRGISRTDHPGRTLEELVELVLRHGTDRYDPGRRPVLDGVYGPYGVELHALPCTIDGDLKSTHCLERSVMADVIDDFVHGPPIDRRGHRWDWICC